jgi:hypothetical protein
MCALTGAAIATALVRGWDGGIEPLGPLVATEGGTTEALLPATTITGTVRTLPTGKVCIPSTDPSAAVLPSVVGLSRQDAMRRLHAAGFRAHFYPAGEAQSKGKAPGVVVWRFPPSGSHVCKWLPLQVYVSSR